MKKLLSTTLLSLFTLIVSAQSFHAPSATFGIINPKLRIQYEKGFDSRFSAGGEFTWYFVNWTGPKFEAFGRIYGGDDATKGFFFQGKLGYGNLSTLEDFSTETKRWSTFGGGIAGGYKFLIGEHFIIDQVFGLQIYTPPTQNNSDDLGNALEGAGWFLTSGLPLDFQVKVGYQF